MKYINVQSALIELMDGWMVGWIDGWNADNNVDPYVGRGMQHSAMRRD